MARKGATAGFLLLGGGIASLLTVFVVTRKRHTGARCPVCEAPIEMPENIETDFLCPSCGEPIVEID